MISLRILQRIEGDISDPIMFKLSWTSGRNILF